MKVFFLCLSLPVLFTLGCTLYQSEARKLIENGTIDTSPTLFAQDEITTCYKSARSPDYLKLPLKVIATPYEKRNFATLSDTEASWLVVHLTDKESGAHFSCEFQFQSPIQLDLQLVSSIQRGVELIDNELGL